MNKCDGCAKQNSCPSDTHYECAMKDYLYYEAETPAEERRALYCEPMEYLDLRDMVTDEVEYKRLDKSVINKAVRYIRDSSRLMEMLDFIVEEAISHCKT